jgi:enoyl-CoA hydratase
MNAVCYEVCDSIAIITFNRPDQLNSINAELRKGLYEAFERFEADDTARVGILTGAGSKAFCAGMDLKEAAQSGLGVPPRGFLPVIGQSVHLTKPTIAAVNGVAYAGGWLLAQMCDLCVAAEHASFAITESRVGRGMPWAPPAVHMVQQRALLELLLTGQPIDAERAREIGFVNHVVPGTELLAFTLALAQKIAANAPLTVRAARDMVYLTQEMGLSAALRTADQLFEPVYRSKDAQEGLRAFREKRKPQWQGH